MLARLATLVPSTPGGKCGHMRANLASREQELSLLFLVVSTPRPERPTELVGVRQSFWPWMAKYEAAGVCKQVYARAGRGAVAILDVDSNDTLHRILNEWADIVPAHFDTYPLVDVAATKAFLASQARAAK